jgi:FkbM family methyltransferase
MNLSPLQFASEKFGIRGIIQVGSNTGQECSQFRSYTKNIVCFEPIPSVFQTLQSHNPDVTCYNFALGDTNEVMKMHISSNNGESSSFLEPAKHIQEFPTIGFGSEMNLEIKRFDSLGINLEHHNVLFSDTQGYELHVLRGFGDLLKNIDVIYVEYTENLYEGDSNLKAITEYVESYGFETIKVYPESHYWGNVLFAKKQ